MFQTNHSLLPYNTFQIDVLAKAFGRFANTVELQALLHANEFGNPLILGGGSNILFTKNYDGLVLKNECMGRDIVAENEDFIYLKAGAGEPWHPLVMHAVANGWGGMENLSLIPGCAGASPMQNIGAYGVEIKDIFHTLDAWHIKDHCLVTFSAGDCAFGYRESIFKNKYKGQFVILNVTYKLSKQPVFNTSYGAIEEALQAMGISTPSLKAVSDAVVQIRQSKLPDPAVTGNAGSFFKNPTIATQHYMALKTDFPEMPGYALSDDLTKVPAGWLIEQCGFKGFRKGNAGVHPKQALVLVNYGHAKGSEILDLSENILLTVKARFGIELEREVNIL